MMVLDMVFVGLIGETIVWLKLVWWWCCCCGCDYSVMCCCGGVAWLVLCGVRFGRIWPREKVLK